MTLAELFSYVKEKLDFLYYPLFTVFQIVLIIIFSALCIRFGRFLINKIFDTRMEFKYKLDDKRLATMRSLTKSVYRYTVYTLAAVAILTRLTQAFNLGSIMTAAGIGGLAIGFGAQSLIKDVISGFFIIMENQFAVGDLITIDNFTGTVEGIELRVIKLRSFNGDLYIIPNGEIKRITNHVRGNKAVLVDIPVAYSSDLDSALTILDKVCEETSQKFSTLVEKPEVLGITEMGSENMIVRIYAKAVANEQWAIERYIRKLVKEQFDEAGIKFVDKFRLTNNSKKGEE